MIGNIKIGICEWSLPMYGPYGCRLAAELGLDGVQLEISDHQRGFPISKPVVQQGYLEVREQYGIEYPDLAFREPDSISMLKPKDSCERSVIEEGLHKAVETAAAMAIPSIMLPNFVASEIKTESDFDAAVEVFQFACDIAAEKNITIAAENLFTTEEWLEFARRVDRPNLSLFFDSQNYYLVKGYDQPKLTEELLPFFSHLHIKDGKNGDLSGDLLGRGDTKFYETIGVLKRSGYKGWIILENYYDRLPLCNLSDDPVELIKRDLAILQDTLG